MPVEELYNNGVDALNQQRYATANEQFNLVEQNYPYSSWAVNAQLMQGYTPVSAEPLHGGDRHARPLHPAASGASRHRLRLLPARALLLRADRRYPARPEGHAARDEGAAGGGEPFPRQRLRPGRAAEDRPVPATIWPARRWRSAAGIRASISTRPRSAASSAWSTTTRPPTTCPEALHRLTEIYLTLGMRDEARKTAAVLGYNYPGSAVVRGQLQPAAGRRAGERAPRPRRARPSPNRASSPARSASLF